MTEHQSASSQEKNLQELRNFEGTLADALELYSTGRALLDYHFGKRNLSQIFKFVLSESGNEAECSNIANRLFLLLERDLRKHFKSHNNSTMTDNESNLFLSRSVIFWELYQLADIPNLLSEDVVKDMTETFKKIDDIVSSMKNQKNKLKDLPRDFLHSLTCMTPTRLSPVLDVSFGRDDEIYAIDNDSSDDDTISSDLQKFIDEMHQCIDSLPSQPHIPKLSSLKCPKELAGRMSAEDSHFLMTKLLLAWDDSCCAVDKRVADGTFNVLRQLLVSASNRDVLVKLFCTHHIKKIGGFQDYSKEAKDSEHLFVSLMNQLGEEEIHNTDLFESMSLEFSWLSLISPGRLIAACLRHSTSNRRIVPNVIKFLLPLRSLSRVSRGPGLFLLDDLLLSFVNTLETTDIDNAIYMLASLVRQKKSVLEPPVVLPVRMFYLVVADRLLSETTRRFALLLLLRMCAVGESKFSPFEWFSEFSTENSKVRAPELLLMLFNLLKEEDKEIHDLAGKNLRALGAKLAEDKIVFTDETIARIDREFSREQWFVKAALVQWFSFSFGKPKIQIPSGLFLSLSSEVADRYEQIIVSFDCCIVECFLRSLFEIALWDHDFAIELLSNDIVLLPNDDNLIEKMALALCDVSLLARSSSQMANCMKVISKVLSIIDPTHADVLLEKISATIYHSIQSQESIHVLAKATKLALYRSGRGGDEREMRAAGLLLHTFCEQANEHIGRVINDYRRANRTRKDHVDREESTITQQKRCESALSEISTLFPVVVSLTHLVPKIPQSLQVLLSSIADFLSSFFDSRVPLRQLDDLRINSIPDNTHYGVARRNSDTRKSPSSERTSRNSCSNPMFARLNDERMSAIHAARQITDSDVHNVVEKKLTGGGVRQNNNNYNGGNGGGGKTRKGRRK